MENLPPIAYETFPKCKTGTHYKRAEKVSLRSHGLIVGAYVQPLKSGTWAGRGARSQPFKALKVCAECTGGALQRLGAGERDGEKLPKEQKIREGVRALLPHVRF